MPPHFLIVNDISTQLTDLFNLSFSRGVFSLILKASEVICAYKKEFKKQCSNHMPIPLLS